VQQQKWFDKHKFLQLDERVNLRTIMLSIIESTQKEVKKQNICLHSALLFEAKSCVNQSKNTNTTFTCAILYIDPSGFLYISNKQKQITTKNQLRSG
jgi:hypothetical protein